MAEKEPQVTVWSAFHIPAYPRGHLIASQNIERKPRSPSTLNTREGSHITPTIPMALCEGFHGHDSQNITQGTL
jgi:hypothetical protein